MRAKIEALLTEIRTTESTSLSGAVRDLLTDLVHICNANQIDIDERLDAAIEIAAEEDQLDANGEEKSCDNGKCDSDKKCDGGGKCHNG